MKETIKVNLSGQLFDLDKDAFSALKEYLDSLEQMFSDKPKEAQEILEDTESRIAELLELKLKTGKNVITISDIHELINQLGTAEEMDGLSGEDKKTDEESNASQDSARTTKGKRRLYRDVDNSILGGVSSGLSAYFDLDPIWIRLLFVFLLFAGMSGGIIYIILWIVIPPAKTTAQKLEMQGQPVNINNIKDKVNEEFGKVKDNVKRFSKSKEYKNFESALSEFFNVLGNVLLVLVKVVGIIVAVSLIVAAVIFLIAFISGGWGFNWHWDWFPNFRITHISLYGICLFLVIAIPAFAILGKIIRWIFDIEKRNNFSSVFGATIWVIALITLIVLMGTNNKGGSFRHVNLERYELDINRDKPLYISLNTLDKWDKNYEHYQIFDFEFIWNSSSDEFYKKPEIEIQRIKNGITKLIIEKRYWQFKNSHKNHYSILSYDWHQSDTLLVLDEFYKCEDEDAWRFPKVKLILKIPEEINVNYDNEAKIIIDQIR